VGNPFFSGEIFPQSYKKRGGPHRSLLFGRVFTPWGTPLLGRIPPRRKTFLPRGDAPLIKRGPLSQKRKLSFKRGDGFLAGAKRRFARNTPFVAYSPTA